MDEQTEPFQRKVAAKHVRNRLTTKGNPAKEAPFNEDPPVERSKSAPPIGVVEELEEQEKPKFEPLESDPRKILDKMRGDIKTQGDVEFSGINPLTGEPYGAGKEKTKEENH